MKNSKEYGKKIAKLYRSLKQKNAKVKKAKFDEPADAIIYAIISEAVRNSATKAIIRNMKENFVDLNELRVSRVEEIVEVIDTARSSAEKLASKINDFLNAIYVKYDIINLAGLKEIGKRQAKKELEELGLLSRFVVNYCFLTSLGGHAVPLTEGMLEYLKASELVHPDASDDDIEGFLERQISSANAYEFYTLLREVSEKSTKTIKKKTEAEKTTEKKVKKTKKTAKAKKK